AGLLCAFAVLLLFGISTPLAAAFALMFGGANGLATIARGAVPLALFGASGYGRLMGRLAGPFLIVQSAAPLIMAFVIEKTSDMTALGLAALFAAAALVCFVVIRRPA
ncbi:MAG TPA: MFS transporter, partial [Pseudolabrys sp.]|nr:MFS transporter [Pseudolabrys sp.]